MIYDENGVVITYRGMEINSMNYKIYLYMENNNDDYLYTDLADDTTLVNGVEI